MALAFVAARGTRLYDSHLPKRERELRRVGRGEVCHDRVVEARHAGKRRSQHRPRGSRRNVVRDPRALQIKSNQTKCNRIKPNVYVYI